MFFIWKWIEEDRGLIQKVLTSKYVVSFFFFFFKFLGAIEFPLGPLPWPFLVVTSELNKTNNPAIPDKVERDISPLLNPTSNHVAILDAMAAVQKFKVNALTFHQVADGILRFILTMSMQTIQIDIAFDVYDLQSIKNAERIEY